MYDAIGCNSSESIYKITGDIVMNLDMKLGISGGLSWPGLPPYLAICLTMSTSVSL